MDAPRVKEEEEEEEEEEVPSRFKRFGFVCAGVRSIS